MVKTDWTPDGVALSANMLNLCILHREPQLWAGIMHLAQMMKQNHQGN